MKVLPMHETLTRPVLVPKYVTQFQCIGAACEDTCCAGWNITLDKPVVQFYRRIKTGPLAGRLKDCIKRERSQSCDAHYALIRLDARTGECPFLEERLCAVQLHYGKIALSDTCSIYPRSTRLVAGQLEQGLALSCSEAARKALLSPDAFEFVMHDLTVRKSDIDCSAAHSSFSAEQMSEIRIFCLQLMRTEGLELWQRLAVLGVFCERLEAWVDAQKEIGLNELIDGFVRTVESGEVLSALAERQPNHDVQAQLFAIFLYRKEEISKSTMLSTVRQQVQQSVLEGLGGLKNDADSQVLVGNYRQGLELLQTCLTENTPFLLEHYLLNEIFSALFPFGGRSVYSHYLQLVSRFCVLRLMLAGRCRANPTLSKEELIDTVQVFCRSFQHNALFAERVNGVLHNTGWSKMEKIFPLL
ncbi:flagellin lysine-N-methylase [Laribacter hongkongensis]|uniref:flagellin lysine-N-methylase n=1 Tax=Laribacter hongkongensis TaxID=168471 RepID=UPI001EFC965B|nr:flagellin lysine-N-methylase [Laribacter hongkongensis]MCG9094401.1 flagellin lysine-N-methylase [Laribacter hongkongensis]